MKMCDMLFYEFYNKPDELYLPYNSNSVYILFQYAVRILNGRLLKAESYIMKDPSYATLYSRKILSKDPSWPHKNGRWPEAEPYIMKDPSSIYYYALYTIRGRWKEAEPHIWDNHDYWVQYKSNLYND